jgi:hypothetical protein
MNEDKNLYYCTDLSLASALVLKFPIDKIDSANTKKVVFIFIDSTQLQNNIENFWNNSMRVSPLEYFNSIRNLKTRIYSNG